MTIGRIIGGSSLLVLAIAVGGEATTFRVNFPTDPLGPAAFPFVSVVLLTLGGLSFLFEKGAVMEPLPKEVALRITGASASFVLYALLLSPLGFVPATTLEFAALAVLFGGRPIQGLVAGVGFAVVLFALFVYGLGLPLPLGVLFS